MRHALLSATMVAVAFTLQNVTLLLAISALVVSGVALTIVNLRLTDFERASRAQSERLDLLERTTEPPRHEG